MKKNIKSIFEKLSLVVNKHSIIIVQRMIFLQLNRIFIIKYVLISLPILVCKISTVLSNCQGIIHSLSNLLIIEINYLKK